MVKLNELLDKYGEYEVSEDRLKEFLVEPKPKSIWDLKEGDRYWCINSFGVVNSDEWLGGNSDIERRKIGNCFLIEKEAIFESKKLRVEAILLKYGRREFKYSKKNYYMYCNLLESSIGIGYCQNLQYQGAIYFDTKELCQKAIEEAREDNIKKYIFGVDSK